MDFFLKFVVVPVAVGVLFFPLVMSIIKYGRRGDGPPDFPDL
jgi:hypothetical protein